MRGRCINEHRQHKTLRMKEKKKKTLFFFALVPKLMSIHARIYLYCSNLLCSCQTNKGLSRILCSENVGRVSNTFRLLTNKNAPHLYCFIQFGKFQMIMPMIVEQQSQEFRLLLSKLLYINQLEFQLSIATIFCSSSPFSFSSYSSRSGISIKAFIK